MAYLVLTILAIFLPTVLFIRKVSKFRQNHPELVAYLTTICATFVGVFFALYFSELQKKSEEIKEGVEILNSCIQENDNLRVTTGLLLARYIRFPDADEFSPEAIHTFDVIGYPELTRSLIIDQKVSRYITYQGYSFAKMQLDRLDDLNKRITTNPPHDSATKEICIKDVRSFCISLAYLEQILSMEQKYLRNEIDSTDLSRFQKIFVSELTGFRDGLVVSKEEMIEYGSIAISWIQLFNHQVKNLKKR